MLHIFVDPAQMKGDLLYVTGKDVNHIKNVMRLNTATGSRNLRIPRWCADCVL